MSGPEKPATDGKAAGNERHGDWYRKLVEESNDVTVVIDRDGTVRYVSPAVERLLGYTSAEVTGDGISDYVHPEDSDAISDAIEQIRAGQTDSGRVEFQHRRADGTWCWLEATLRSRLDSEMDGIILNGRDITERKERETELRTTKERMKMALEGANLGIWDWDMESDEVTRDELLTEMLGYTQSEMGDHLAGWEQLVHPEGKARHNEALAEHIEVRTPYYQCEYRLKTNSGDWKWVRTMGKVVERDETGEPVRAVGIHQDIDDRKRAELALEAERDMFREGPAVVFKWEDAEGWPVRYASENVESVFGYSPEELQSSEFEYADLVHEEDLDRLEREMDEYTGEGPDLFSPDPYRVITADGDVRWVMEYTKDLQGEGERNHLQGYIVDITERKRRELELQKFEAAVEQSGHAIYMTDTDGTIEYVNPAFEAVTGYSEADAVGDTPRLLQSGEYDDTFYDEFWGTILDGDRWEAEIVDERADGEEIVLNQSVAPITDEDGEVRKFVAVARDITERKMYEEALEDTREELRQVIDLSPDLIFARNREGQYLLANETTAELFGKDPGELEGMSAADIEATSDQFGEFSADDVAVIDSGESRVIPEKELRTADGETRVVKTTKIPFETAKTGEAAVLSYARDVTELKAQERELKAREEKYRNLFEDSRDALMLMDRDGYLDCNEQTLNLFGVESVDAFVEYSPWELSPQNQPDGADSKEAALERIDEALEAGKAFFEWTHQRDDGTSFPAEVKLSRFEHGGDRVIHALVRDITERKEHQQELAAERNRIRAITNAIPDVTFVYDREGRYREILTGQEDLLVNDMSELLDSKVTDVLPPDAAQTIVEGIEESLDTETVQTVEYSLELDGEQTWFGGRIAPMPGDGHDEVVLLSRDITARKRHERELEAREEKYRNLFEDTRDALMLLDRDGFFDCNKQALDLFGVESVDAFVDHSPWELSPQTQPDGRDSQAAALDHVETAFEEGEAFFEWTHQRVDGTDFPAEVKLSRFEHQGEPALHALVRDITERKEYERQLEEQRDSLDTLNQVLRHDIRNDIQMITAYTEMLETECDNDEGHEYIETVLENAEHAVELTTSAREMADVMLSADKELQQVDLHTVLESEIQEVQSAYSEAEITAETAIPPVSVQANDMLGSVFRNLLKNAIQHNDTAAPKVAVSATDRDDTVVVRIADNGPGIPDALKDDIFGKGEKGLDSHGTGIGLYLVKTLVESYGGDVRVEDRAGDDASDSGPQADDEQGGTVFVVEVPKASAE